MRWCSPAGGEFEVRDGLAWVPFEWSFVDAYYLMESFADLRAARGDSHVAMSARLWRRGFEGRCERWRLGVGATLILHPFLMLDPAWREGVGELLGEIGALARAGELWVGPGGALAV